MSNDPATSRPVFDLVIGLDDSKGAATALAWADGLVADRADRGLPIRATAVTAWSPPAFDLAGGLLDTDLLEEGAAEALDRVLAALPDPTRFETVVRSGPPAEVIMAEADRLEADLIVLGTRGRGALAQLLLGSVSRSVAARAERPVAIVPTTASWSAGPTVVGVDGSPGGDAALAWAVANDDGPITAVSAWHLPSDAIYDPNTIDVDAFEAEVRTGLETVIDDMAERFPDADVRGRVNPVVQRDDARLALLREAKGAARIVLGARSHRGVRGLLLGSTVDYVASHTNQVIIVVPPAETGAADG